jgi:hypothetical protein
MSKVFTAKEICERALRNIGAFAITDSAADGEQLREAMIWLDLIQAEAAGTMRLWSQIPQTVGFALTNGTGTYNLHQSLGAELPPDKVQFPYECWWEDEAGRRSPIDIVTRDVFEQLEATETGAPTKVHIDRMPTPTARFHPVPAAEDPGVYRIKLVVQTYAPNVAPGGVTGSTPSASVLHQFRQAWQRWLILKLSIDLGGGAIKKINQQSLDNWRKEEEPAKKALEAFENREHENTPPCCDPWGM